MKARSVRLFVLLCLLLATFVPASAGGVVPVDPTTPPPSADSGQMINETPTKWYVEFSGAPKIDGGNDRALKKEADDFRSRATAAGLQYTELYSFRTLWNGLAVQVAPSQLGKLLRIQGVKAIYPVGTVAIPETSVSPEDASSLAMIGADIVHSELGYTGAGVKVAIVDTGVDYDHPDLGGCFGQGCRVATGFDFVGDAYNADPTDPNYSPIPSPDPDPDDCNGHGTHVSGIVGANGAVIGVAPDVTFGAYRVFGCAGSADDFVILAALERAYQDGMNVLNMSLGEAFTWPQAPLGIASNRLVNHGMVVVASIGNSGASGTFSAGAPGLGEKVIGVASYDNTHVTLTVFQVDSTDVGFIPMSGAPLPPTSGTEEIVYVGRGCNVDLPLLADPNGKVALIVRGTCTFREKAINAINAGATAVVIHNNVPGNFAGTVGTPPLSVPVVGISQADGLYIRGLTPPVNMTWTDQTGSFPNPTGGLISSFSSYGLSPDLALKPDIGAPGGSIYSTYPLEQGGYATLSGTSMASPHTAGAAALYLQAHPGTPAGMMRAILQNSADPSVWSLAPSLGFLDNVHRQGAGLLDIDDAILATTLITPGKLSLGETQKGVPTQTLTVYNNGGSSVTYDLSYESAIATTGTYPADLDFWLTDELLSFNPASVTVPAGGMATVKVNITAPTGPDQGQYGGYVIFTPQGEGRTYRVPYAGFVGDYQSLPVITPTANGFPWLASLSGGFFTNQPNGATFTMVGDDIPFFLVHLNHQSDRLRLEVYDANTNALLGRAYEQTYMPRNSESGSFFAFPWDGVIAASRPRGPAFSDAPDGDYYVVLSIQKALGDPGNPAHWETWTSPIITIDRP